MNVNESLWDELASSGGAGMARRRLHPDSLHNLFVSVQYPAGQRMLTLQIGKGTATSAVHTLRHLPRTRGMELQFAGHSDGRRELQLSLTDSNLREVFNPLITDIASAAAAAESNLDCVLAFVSRFQGWISLLAAVAENGLSSDYRRGLFGELWTLRRMLSCGIDEKSAVGAWTGPLAADQDFQLHRGALEVKTTAAKQPQTIVIASERQLDDRGVDLLLLVLLLVDERRGGHGASLNSLVDVIRTEIRQQSISDAFDDLLVRAGYLPHQRDLYDEPRYTPRDERYYRVEGDFPRVTEPDLRPGVGDCTYRISTAGLDVWAVPSTDIDDLLRCGAHAVIANTIEKPRTTNQDG